MAGTKTDHKLRRWLFRKIINPFTIRLLCSSASQGIDRFILLISYDGRKTGRRITHPASYSRQGEDYILFADGGWWVNMLQARPVELLVMGEAVRGTASAYTDAEKVAEAIHRDYELMGYSAAQRRHRLPLDTLEVPTIEQITPLVEDRVLVVVTPQA